MNSLRKWFYRPRKDDRSLMAQFYFADEELNLVAGELDSFDGRKDPERCTALVNQLRHCQDRVLNICISMMEEVIPTERASRDFRIKFPDDVMQENLAGQLWFGAECLAAGSSIMNRETESTRMRPLAKAVTKTIETVRNLLREQCLKPVPEYTEKIRESLKIFDRLFAEFELNYVSAMVPVKSVEEHDVQQNVVVLFSETVQRALRLGLTTQEQIDDYDPALMFTIPRLAIVAGLVMFPDGPLNLDREPRSLSELFRPFRTLLSKIRELLWTMSTHELAALEKALCSMDEPDPSSTTLPVQSSSSPTPEDTSNFPATAYANAAFTSDFVRKFYASYPSCRIVTPELGSLYHPGKKPGMDKSGERKRDRTSGKSGSSRGSRSRRQERQSEKFLARLNASSSGVEERPRARRRQKKSHHSRHPHHSQDPPPPPPPPPLPPMPPQHQDTDSGEEGSNHYHPHHRRRHHRQTRTSPSSLSRHHESRPSLGHHHHHHHHPPPQNIPIPPPPPYHNHHSHSQQPPDPQQVPLLPPPPRHYHKPRRPRHQPVTRIKSIACSCGTVEENETGIPQDCPSPDSVPESCNSSRNAGNESGSRGQENGCSSGCTSTVTTTLPEVPDMMEAGDLDDGGITEAVSYLNIDGGNRDQTGDAGREEWKEKSIEDQKKDKTEEEEGMVNNQSQEQKKKVAENFEIQECDENTYTRELTVNESRSSLTCCSTTSPQLAASATGLGEEYGGEVGGGRCSSGSTSPYNSGAEDDEEVALALQAAEVAATWRARARFTDAQDLIHRLFVCISGVADQLQTNYASDLRKILKCVFLINQSPPEEPKKGELVEEDREEEEEEEEEDEEDEINDWSASSPIHSYGDGDGENSLGGNDSERLSVESAEDALVVIGSPEHHHSSLAVTTTNSIVPTEEDHSTPEDYSPHPSPPPSPVTSRSPSPLSHHRPLPPPPQYSSSVELPSSSNLALSPPRYPNHLRHRPHRLFSPPSDIPLTSSSPPPQTPPTIPTSSPPSVCPPSIQVPAAIFNDHALMQFSEVTQASVPPNVELLPAPQRQYVESFGVIPDPYTRSPHEQPHSLYDGGQGGESGSTGRVRSRVVQEPPAWVPDQQAPRCMACGAAFTMVRRRHHCRNCGKVFCSHCSQHAVPLPHYGIWKAVRVCNVCFLYYVTFSTDPTSAATTNAANTATASS
ncbi:hypothetical protein Pcinc_031798 [Petrolisthes cinctipes]|uniref:Lateral signaling target protein 2 homolog n=1 Tax=Petrolisthes cinctipes TaxID=88211 RepID=A0AAE1K2H8_PETCI|nr:hypothetical protein Pcinc_031798 [Petrolisthes cinctipes]